MFKIGDFSKLCQVTVKTLRYYDDLGLLKPSSVDSFTGYRYYSVDQLPRLTRLLAFKDLGFSLEQIRLLLDEDPPPAQIRGMLRMRQAQIQENLAEETARLARVEARLKLMEQEEAMPTYEVLLKRSEPQRFASLRDTLPHYGDIGRLYGEVYAFLGQNGIPPAGPSSAIYHDREYRESDVDVEALVPIAATMLEGPRVKCRELPGGQTLASTLHRGSFESVGQAYEALMKWIQCNGYQVAGPNREIYLNGPGMASDPALYVTEIQFPIEKV